MPQRYETGTAAAHFQSTVEGHYCQIYFEILDHAISTIKAWFDSHPMPYTVREDLLIKSACGEDSSSKLNTITDFYGDDFSDKERLVVQLKSLEIQFEDQREVDLCDIVTVLSFSSAERGIFSKVVTLLKLVLINPVTNDFSERSFLPCRDYQ